MKKNKPISFNTVKRNKKLNDFDNGESKEEEFIELVDDEKVSDT